LTPWTALLESLHSSLIDELIELHPEPKPELGMPVRLREFAWPSPQASDLLVVETEFPEGRCLAMLALEPGFSSKLKISVEPFWNAMLKRAGSEFARRNIRPKFYSSSRLAPGAGLPGGCINPVKLVWVPFRIPQGAAYLGLGV
jgi:hypothetical protein